jgi:transcriptional regulator NrdR family protein
VNCPTCGHGENRVLATQGGSERVTRLRQCCQCGKRWKTAEAPLEVLERAERVLSAARQLQVLAGEV